MTNLSHNSKSVWFDWSSDTEEDIDEPASNVRKVRQKAIVVSRSARKRAYVFARDGFSCLKMRQ